MFQNLIAQEKIVLLVVGELILHEVGDDPLNCCKIALLFVVPIIDKIWCHTCLFINPIQVFDEWVRGASYLDDRLSIQPILECCVEKQVVVVKEHSGGIQRTQ